jgi:hypothetical protein
LFDLQNNPFDLIECDLVVAASARALMRGHLLGVLEQAAVEQIDGDAGRAEAVAAKPGEEPGLTSAATLYRVQPGTLARGMFR